MCASRKGLRAGGSCLPASAGGSVCGSGWGPEAGTLATSDNGPQQTKPPVRLPAAAKLFYWMRLAYRDDDALTHPFVNAHVALPLFCLDHFGAPCAHARVWLCVLQSRLPACQGAPRFLWACSFWAGGLLPEERLPLCRSWAAPCAVPVASWGCQGCAARLPGTAQGMLTSAPVCSTEMIWDDTTDTHAVLGWNSTQVVVAFR